MVTVVYQVLGPVVAFAGGAARGLGGPKQRLVLALLLRDAGRVVSDDRLIVGLWPDDPPLGARHTIQTYVSELRKILDDDVRREGVGYRLVIERDAVDAHRFEALVAAAQARMADAPAGAAALLREALALWHGEPYADLADTLELQGEIHRLRQARLAAVEDRMQAELDSGRHAQVVIELEALVREHPYRERLHALLMLALYRGGRQAEALRAFDRTRRTLAEDLGIDPSPELQELQQKILEQDDTLLPPAALADDGKPPEVVRGFELRELVARRGHASMWRAYQPSAAREVTATVIGPVEANAPAFIRGFAPLAQRLAQIEHPHLMPLLDHWRDPRGAYLVTPWLRGDSVRRALTHGPWSLPATLRMLEQVGGALGALHRAGLVHGDVGAATVLLDGEGNALLDVAAAVSRAEDEEPNAPPELRHGQLPSPSSDVYALGGLAIEALVGVASLPEEPVVALRRAYVPLPTGLNEVLARATAADPAARYGRVEDLLRDVRRVAGADVVGLRFEEDVPEGIRNPYKGLRAFQEPDAADFHGREALVEQMLGALADRRLVAVVGPSGSGKSSLVRAGLLPALRGDAMAGAGDWLVTDMFPGAYPFEELEAGLLRVAVERPDGLLADLLADERGMLRAVKRILPAEGELLVVIDQFEELFSLNAESEIRRLFLDGLVTLASDEHARTRVVITMRADFFDRPLEHHAFGQLVRDGLVPVTMPSPAELARAISQPARGVGIDYEPGLIQVIVRDVADQPGALPLLQHALTELFERRDRRTLTAAAYVATGGVLGALGRRAEELYHSLPPDAQHVAEQVFLRLVAVDPHSEDARRRVRRSELAALEADPGVLDTVVRQFGAHRLLSFDRDPVTRGPTIEVSHEALFREWSTLRGWIEGRREDLLLHRRLAAAVAEWEQAGAGADYLLVGGRLEQFERWASATDLVLTEGERAYLDASRAHEHDLITRRRRRRRRLVAGLAAVAAVAVLLAGFALVQRGRADDRERMARARALAAASLLQLPVDHDLGVLLALEAVAVSRSAGRPVQREALETLHEAVITHRVQMAADVGGTLLGAGPESDRVFVTGPPGGRAAVWDLSTGQPAAVLRDDGRQPFAFAVSADGRRAVETFVGDPTLVWDLEADELITQLPPTAPFQARPALSPDGQLLALANFDEPGGGRDQSISIWDVAAATELLRIPYPGNARRATFSPDGQLLAVADMQNAVVRLFDVATGDVVRVLGDPSDARGVDSVAFDPVGERVAMFVFTPQEIQIVEVETGEVVRSTPLGTAARGGRLCYSQDGSVLAVATQDELFEVYDRSGAPLVSLPGSAAIDSLVCGADGERVGLATEEGVVRVWGLTAADAGEVLSIAAPAPFTGTWTPDGAAVLTTHYGGAQLPGEAELSTGTLHRYDPTSGELLSRATDLHPFPPWWLALSPDGRYVAANGNPFGEVDPAQAAVDVPRNARLVIHDAATLDVVRELEPPGWPIGFAPDSTRFLAGAAGRAFVFDVATGSVVARLSPPPLTAEDRVPELAGGGFLPDGRHVVLVTGNTREGWVLEIETGEVAATFCGSGEHFQSALSPDGQYLAVGSSPRTVDVWDLETLLQTGGAACETDPAAGRVATLDGDGFVALEFGPDGKSLAGGGFDGPLSVWDLPGGELRLRIEHPGPIGGASFSPDGNHVMVTVNDAQGAQHAIRIYTLDVDELVAIARDEVTRGLTDDECRTYLQLAACP